jgi:hypothetical protein
MAKDAFPRLASRRVDGRHSAHGRSASDVRQEWLAHFGMPLIHPFWTEPAGKWFQQPVWSGEGLPNQTVI